MLEENKIELPVIEEKVETDYTDSSIIQAREKKESVVKEAADEKPKDQEHGSENSEDDEENDSDDSEEGEKKGPGTVSLRGMTKEEKKAHK